MLLHAVDPDGSSFQRKSEPLTRVRVSWNSSWDSPRDPLGINRDARLNQLFSCSRQLTRTHNPSASNLPERSANGRFGSWSQPLNVPQPPLNAHGRPI